MLLIKAFEITIDYQELIIRILLILKHNEKATLFRIALIFSILLMLPRQGSNLDFSDPESDVLPITPRGSFGSTKL